jgi:uncharacterized protein (TIGR03437 family)
MPFETGPRNTYYKAFVSKLDAESGSLSVSSYLTAGAQPWIASDTFGNAYVGGSTTKPQSPYSGLPAPPPVITGVDALVAKVQPQFPGSIRINSVGNAFTRRSGPVSPGQITAVAVEGLTPTQAVDLTFTPSAPLPRALAETQVLFDGEAAPLVSVAAGRVVAVAPYSLADKRQVAVQVMFQGTLSAPIIAEVVADPGYLSLDGSGAGQAYARNPDGTLNSSDNPAPLGSVVTLYATGTGQVDTACPEGGVSAPDATAAGQFRPVAGSVCGLFQTLFQVPGFGTRAVIPNTPLTIALR